MLAGWPKNMGYILKQADELNIDKIFIAPGGTIGPEIIEIAGEASNELIYINEFDVESDKEEVKGFRKKFMKKYGRDPELFSAMGYDATNIIAMLIEKCEGNSECIKDGLYGIKGYKGASGIISFDEYGDVIKPMIMMTIKNGKHVKFKV